MSGEPPIIPLSRRKHGFEPLGSANNFNSLCFCEPLVSCLCPAEVLGCGCLIAEVSWQEEVSVHGGRAGRDCPLPFGTLQGGRLLTGWSLVRIRPGEPNKNKYLGKRNGGVMNGRKRPVGTV